MSTDKTKEAAELIGGARQGRLQAQLGASIQSSWRLPAKLVRDIDREAKKAGVSRNAWLVLTLQAALRQKEPAPLL